MSLSEITTGIGEVAGEAIAARAVYTSPMREAPTVGFPIVAVIWGNSNTDADARTMNARDKATGKLQRKGIVRIHTGDLFVLLSQTGDVESEEPDIVATVDALMNAFDGDATLRGVGMVDRVASFRLGQIERFDTTVAGVRFAGVKAPFTAYET